MQQNECIQYVINIIIIIILIVGFMILDSKIEKYTEVHNNSYRLYQMFIDTVKYKSLINE
jgi:hypothetical protein